VGNRVELQHKVIDQRKDTDKNSNNNKPEATTTHGYSSSLAQASNPLIPCGRINRVSIATLRILVNPRIGSDT